MWSYFVIPLAILSCIAASDDDCTSPLHEVCPDTKIPQAFPATSEELENVCSAATDVLECSIDYDERCKRFGDRLERGRFTLHTMNYVCDKNSPIYPAIVDNLQCIKDVVENPSEFNNCYRLNQETVLKHVKVLMEMGSVDAEKEQNMRQCVQAMHFFSCIGVKLEKKCGEDVLEPYISVVRKMSELVVGGECEEEIGRFLPTVIQLYKMEEENLEELD